MTFRTLLSALALATLAVTSESLTETLQQISSLQAALRASHLRAHLEQARILSSEQRTHYAHLRGYASGSGHQHQH